MPSAANNKRAGSTRGAVLLYLHAGKVGRDISSSERDGNRGLVAEPVTMLSAANRQEREVSESPIMELVMMNNTKGMLDITYGHPPYLMNILK